MQPRAFLSNRAMPKEYLGWLPYTSARSVATERVEVGAFYWTDLAPDIVNSEREEQGSISV
jgi:hypothetical protein